MHNEKTSIRQVFYPLKDIQSILKEENAMNSGPNAVKWLYLHCNFQKFCVCVCVCGGGGMPLDHPMQVLP